jgi:arylformamidase
MSPAIVTVEWNEKTFHADLTTGHCIAIPLNHTEPQPNAYFAPLYEAFPHKVNGWIGDTREGASVNFYDLRINPHGNGTHTECVGHISKERYSIHQSLNSGRWVAQLISAYPQVQDDSDRIIDKLEWEEGVQSIIIRSMPNHDDKKSRQYSGTNPPYLSAHIAQRMSDMGVLHLLLDLPSVDRENDGGALAAHKAFWRYPDNPRLNATITEMIYVDNMIPDGLYLLEIQIPALELDASPSRPFIYALR